MNLAEDEKKKAAVEAITYIKHDSIVGIGTGSTVNYFVKELGKIKDKITVSADASEDQIKELALACEKVQAAMNGQEPKKIIVIKSRLVNIVV